MVPQSLLAIALLLRLELHLLGALTLLALFSVQFGLGFVNQADEAKDIAVPTGLAWVYIGLAVAVSARNAKALLAHARFGLLNRA